MSAGSALGHLWALPVTIAGVLHALLLGARPAGVKGLAWRWVAPARGPLAWFFVKFRVSAYTWGACVVLRSPALLHDEALHAHEEEHVRQTLLLGPFMPLAYVCASLLALARGGTLYRDNAFEIAARRVAAATVAARAAASLRGSASDCSDRSTAAAAGP